MKNYFALSLAIVALTVSISTALLLNRKVEKIIVIDAIKVFNEYRLKQDLEARVQGELENYSTQLDSLKAIGENALRRSDTNTALAVAVDVKDLQQHAADAYATSNKNINEQVWKRLNPLIDEFGKEMNYRVIIGANGMGSVLYKNESIDKTDDIIRYINKNYEKSK